MTTPNRCGFCPLDGCGPEQENCPLRQKPKPGRVTLNVLAGLVLLGSAGAYDTTPMPLWLAALCLCICVAFLAQLLPDPEVTE